MEIKKSAARLGRIGRTVGEVVGNPSSLRGMARQAGGHLRGMRNRWRNKSHPFCQGFDPDAPTIFYLPGFACKRDGLRPVGASIDRPHNHVYGDGSEGVGLMDADDRVKTIARLILQLREALSPGVPLSIIAHSQGGRDAVTALQGGIHEEVDCLITLSGVWGDLQFAHDYSALMEDLSRVMAGIPGLGRNMASFVSNMADSCGRMGSGAEDFGPGLLGNLEVVAFVGEKDRLVPQPVQTPHPAVSSNVRTIHFPYVHTGWCDNGRGKNGRPRNAGFLRVLNEVVGR